MENGKPTHFTVFTKGAGKAPLNVQFNGPMGEDAVKDLDIIDNYDYSHTVKYTPVQQVGSFSLCKVKPETGRFLIRFSDPLITLVICSSLKKASHWCCQPVSISVPHSITNYLLATNPVLFSSWHEWLAACLFTHTHPFPKLLLGIIMNAV